LALGAAVFHLLILMGEFAGKGGDNEE